ncbi:magnesium transporter MgtE N-terminal domain-containing protein [Arcanobacterium hippocoleae]|uniref:Flagellar motility protein MotE (MotC chaperone)/sporulation protein YlmC with PRC-barrel domain n=1 Tax=Arcanobacterium hippocoleae TaxID=149017 RepID=A0ABU1T018_9ACTO|nr:CBS domain-containing protein [Arcanobacterium hippocoleae]MDR6938651.1 flagellar motility protein MotE (MotC chaperone)/sporulation protein YlmC with PRC-barrel domain [Arcanobacterium hippocoleae]
MTIQMNRRVFIGRLAGTDVFDPLGDRVGSVKDVVVVFRLKGAPLAVGLVVEVVGKRRVFLPLTRVTTIANGQVITNGVLNIRRFSQRDAETLVVNEMFDRIVEFKDGSGTALLEDVAMELTRSREWRLTQLYVRMDKGSEDAGNTRVVEFHEVTGFNSKLASQGASSILAQLEGMKAPDVADLLRDLPDERIISVANALGDERLADIIEELGEEDRVTIMGSLDVERAADVLDVMQPDDAADLIATLPKTQAEILLNRMEPDEAEDVRRLMSYENRSAGGLMTTDPIVLPPDATVATALAHARRSDIPPALATMIFVCRPPLETPTGRFLGVVHLQRALREPPATLLGSLIDSDLEPFAPDAKIGTITRIFATYNITAMPVVDEKLLVGAVSVDDLLDHLLPKHWRDYDELILDHAINESFGAESDELAERSNELENNYLEPQIPYADPQMQAESAQAVPDKTVKSQAPQAQTDFMKSNFATDQRR